MADLTIGKPQLNLDESDLEVADVDAEAPLPGMPPSPAAQEIITLTARELSRMEVKDPEILRATKASTALHCFGRVLHKDFDGDTYHESFQTEKIECFWSHSWHAESWAKILLLLVIYNGRAALLAGHLGAILGMTFFYFQLLPAYPRAFSIEGATYDFGPWGLIFGCCATIGLLLTWQPRSKVFLDRVCIHQTDAARKAAGIMAIGGFLKHTDTLLVIWDRTYPTRLWTIFELAAFLKSHGEEETETKARMLIRPTFTGQMVAGLFVLGIILNVCVAVVSLEDAVQTLLVGSVPGLVFLHIFFSWLPHHFRYVNECSKQLERFSLSEAKAFCCTSNHMDESGQKMVCDRQIIVKCIRSWFGSDEKFEECVRTQGSSAIRKGLGKNAFPFHWLLGLTSVTFWTYADFVVARFRAGAHYYALVGLINMLASTFLYGYVLTFLCILVAYKISAVKNRCLKYFSTSLGAWLILAVAGAGNMLQSIFMSLLGDELQGMLLWAVFWTLVSMAAWWIWVTA